MSRFTVDNGDRPAVVAVRQRHGNVRIRLSGRRVRKALACAAARIVERLAAVIRVLLLCRAVIDVVAQRERSRRFLGKGAYQFAAAHLSHCIVRIVYRPPNIRARSAEIDFHLAYPQSIERCAQIVAKTFHLRPYPVLLRPPAEEGIARSRRRNQIVSRRVSHRNAVHANAFPLERHSAVIADVSLAFRKERRAVALYRRAPFALRPLPGEKRELVFFKSHGVATDKLSEGILAYDRAVLNFRFVPPFAVRFAPTRDLRIAHKGHAVELGHICGIDVHRIFGHDTFGAVTYGEYSSLLT